MKPYTQWAVYKGKKFSGIIETNLPYAIQYWATRPEYRLIGGYGFEYCYPRDKWRIK